MTLPELRAGQATVPQRLLSTAAACPGQRALAGGAAGPGRSYAELAAAIQQAAAGLAARGLLSRDVVGVMVPDAACHVLATLAVRAAGGVPSPVRAGLSVPEMAGQLADCGARMLLTGPPLAAAALAAADRSWVRQVISFGDAAGATPFTELLRAGTMPPAPARPDELALLPYQRQPGGCLAAAAVTQHDLAGQLAGLAVTAAICARDVVLAGPPAGDGRAYTALLDHALCSGAAVIAVPAGQVAAEAARYQATVAITAESVPAGTGDQLRVLAVAS
ncbi:MAG TPA: AMP-binding protein [Streptosporangiaceae bacterium]|jgi:acyl-CoA synthetase (AMP-forming)/AMP-acid ligase II